MPSPKTRKDPQILSPRQQHLLLDTLHQAENVRDGTLISLVLKTGLKSAEVCGLNVADVWQDSEVITTLKVRREIGIVRRLSINHDIQDAIENFIGWKRQTSESLLSSAPLFCTARTQKRLVPRDLQRMMEKACAIVGQNFTLSDLRHTFATELYQETGDLESVRVALNVSRLKPEQTAMYTHLSESRSPAVNLPSAKRESDVDIVPSKNGIWQTYDVTDLSSEAGATCLYEDRHGYLWFGTMAGGLYRYDGSEFVNYTTEDGLAHNRITWKMCEDREGRLWIPTWDGVSCFDGETFVTYTTADGLAHDYIWTVYIDSKERLWFPTEGGGVSCFDGRAFVNYTLKDGLASNYVRAICEDHLGQLWFGTGGLSGSLGEGVSCFDGQRFITYTTEDGLGDDSFVSIYEDRQGHLWFGTWASGVSTFDGQRFVTYTTEDGLLANLVTDILQDREGGLWFAHQMAGLTYYNPDSVQTLTKTPAHGFLFQDSQGGIWSQDTEKSVCRLFDEAHYRQTFDATVRCVAEDSRGALWVATLGDGLYCYDSLVALQHGDRRRYTQADGLGSNRVYSVFETRDGTIWAGTIGSPGCLCRFTGVAHAAGKAFEALPTSHKIISRLFEDGCGHLWMGGVSDGGLSCYDPGTKRLRNYTLADGFLR